MKENTKVVLAICLLVLTTVVIGSGVYSWVSSNILFDTSSVVVSYNHSGVLSDVRMYRDKYLIMEFDTDVNYSFIQIGFVPVDVETWLEINNFIDEDVFVCYNRVEYVDEDFKKANGIHDYNIFKSIEKYYSYG